MIECKHKQPFQVTNEGLDAFFCVLLKKWVNDDICSNCEFREGEMIKGVCTDLKFPKRKPKEIEIIYEVCKGCPLHDTVNKTCVKLPYDLFPTDTKAQNPNNHCPEDKW